MQTIISVQPVITRKKFESDKALRDSFYPRKNTVRIWSNYSFFSAELGRETFSKISMTEDFQLLAAYSEQPAKEKQVILDENSTGTSAILPLLIENREIVIEVLHKPTGRLETETGQTVAQEGIDLIKIFLCIDTEMFYQEILPPVHAM